MNDIREMVRADLAARLKATVKRRRPKPKGMLQRAAIAAAHVDVDEDVVDEDVVDEDDVASEIRDAPLYRQTHGTFEDYCKERWGMTGRSARRFIAASSTVEQIGPMGPIPTSERQARTSSRTCLQLQTKHPPPNPRRARSPSWSRKRSGRRGLGPW